MTKKEITACYIINNSHLKQNPHKNFYKRQDMFRLKHQNYVSRLHKILTPATTAERMVISLPLALE
jgi:hypothetical protein